MWKGWIRVKLARKMVHGIRRYLRRAHRTRADEFALFYKCEHARQSVFNGARANLYTSRPRPIGSGTSRQTVVPGSSNSRSKIRFFGTLREESVYGFEVRTGHGENVRSSIDQRRRSAAGCAEHLDSRLPLRRLATAYRLGGWPRTACTPADATSMSFRLPVMRRKSPSAIGLRQMFPVQTKRTFFTARERAANAFIKLEANPSKSISGGLKASFRQ